MAGKGNYFTDHCIRRITVLLATDLTIPEIAERMSCSRTSIVSINRKFQVRAYAGKRTTWEPGGVQPIFQSPS
jgi:hypothetical protein